MKTCGHVIKKKASGKLFWHAGGPEKQGILFAWPTGIFLQLLFKIFYRVPTKKVFI